MLTSRDSIVRMTATSQLERSNEDKATYLDENEFDYDDGAIEH